MGSSKRAIIGLGFLGAHESKRKQNHPIPKHMVWWWQVCYASGAKVGLGYLNLPELTKERFIPNPFEPGQLLHKTGDFARWLPNVDLELLGRKDDF